MTTLAGEAIKKLDPYTFMAVIGKRVIHPGGRASTEAILACADFTPSTKVLDVGCGVATTAIEIAKRFGAHVTALDISPLMLERAQTNITAANVSNLVSVEHGDILKLDYPDDAFDVVIAEAVTMFVNRQQAATELARVTKPTGRVLATEFFWRKAPTPEAREIFLGQLCPGLAFDTIEDWVKLYESAGLTNLETVTGPFEMMTPKGYLADEGIAHSLAVMARVATRPAKVRKMAWLTPRIGKAVPYLGYIVVTATKPR